MLANKIITRAAQFLARSAPGIYDRAQIASLYANPDLFVREALWRIGHPNNALFDNAPKDRDNALHFLAFAAPLVHTSSSQFYQDLWALWETGGKREGYFVEFGATDGKVLSNTYMLEKRMGWKGIVAEPNPHFHKELRENRSCCISTKAVYVESGRQVEFALAGTPSYSYIGSGERSIMVETISLGDLLTEIGAPRDIDFLSVDTEGSEADILEGFDFKRWHVRCIAVEHNHTANRHKLFEILTARGFRRKWPFLGHVDDWYINAD